MNALKLITFLEIQNVKTWLVFVNRVTYGPHQNL